MNIHEVENLLRGDGWQYTITSSDAVDFSLDNGEHVSLTLLPNAMRCSITCPPSVLSIVRLKYTSVFFQNVNTILWNCEELVNFLELCAQCENEKTTHMIRKARQELNNLSQRLLNITVSERNSEQTQRIGQDLLRKYLFAKYGKCQITGIKEARLLRASHILPWCEGLGPKMECLNPENVLLLSVAYDALFNDFLISFDAKTGRLFKAECIDWETLNKLGIMQDVKLDISSEEQAYFLSLHNQRVLGIAQGG